MFKHLLVSASRMVIIVVAALRVSDTPSAPQVMGTASSTPSSPQVSGTALAPHVLGTSTAPCNSAS